MSWRAASLSVGTYFRVRVPPAKPPRNRSQRSGLRCYLGAMRRAPSRRMTSPLSIVLETMCSASAAYSSGRPSRGGNGTDSPSASRTSSGRPASSGVSNRPGAIAQTRMPYCGEVARGREREADDAALGGRVGDLADLAVVGGDRGGVDADAALALVVGVVAEHRGGREAQHVEGADQVDRGSRVSNSSKLCGPLRPAIFSAGPMPAQQTRSAARRSPAACGDGGRDLLGVGDVGGDEVGAELVGQRAGRARG